MTWKEVFPQLLQGKFFKLPTWTGYWSWDDHKKMIIMHCRVNAQGIQENIPLSKTNNMTYTLQNIASDEWIEATPENCTLLGGLSTFDWKSAAKYLLKHPNAIIRSKHWKEGIFIQGYQQGGIKLHTPVNPNTKLYEKSGKVTKIEDWNPNAEDLVVNDFYFIS